MNKALIHIINIKYLIICKVDIPIFLGEKILKMY